jgi:uncharacterized OB-fold protein
LTSTHSKPIPDLDDPDYLPYWQACQASRLVVQQCAQCLIPRWPPRPLCRTCGSRSIGWVEAGTEGCLYSWTTVGHPYDPAFNHEVPYTVGVVELEQHRGIRLLGTVLHDDRDLAVGDICRVDFRRVAEGVHLPIWRHQAILA